MFESSAGYFPIYLFWTIFRYTYNLINLWITVPCLLKSRHPGTAINLWHTPTKLSFSPQSATMNKQKIYNIQYEYVYRIWNIVCSSYLHKWTKTQGNCSHCWGRPGLENTIPYMYTWHVNWVVREFYATTWSHGERQLTCEVRNEIKLYKNTWFTYGNAIKAIQQSVSQSCHIQYAYIYYM